MESSFTKKLLLLSCLILSFTCFLFCDSYYDVAKGDTLYSISRKYQLTVAELRTANNLSENDVLKAGQKLIIPKADISVAATLSGKVVSEKTNQKTEIHIVEKGETLYRIAQNSNMTLPQLLSINNLDSSLVIKVGQKIKVFIKSTDENKNTEIKQTEIKDEIKISEPKISDNGTSWPVKNPTITSVNGKVSGVQLSATTNEPVACVKEGTVIYTGVYRGFGKVLFIQSKTGLIYAYTNLSSVSVKKGDYIVFGKEIGKVGIDSITGKPQLMFMVFQNGQPIDPSVAPRG